MTPVIILFLQQEVSIFAGVTRMPACIRLTVTLSTFLCKQTIKRWLMLQMCGYSNCWHQHDHMKTLTCSHSPTPLRVPFRSQWHSGMRDKSGWGYENVNGRGGGGALQWIDTDCRILRNSRVKHNIVKPSSFQRFAHQRSKGAFQAVACVQLSGGKKRKLFPQCPATVNQMHSWDIKNTPPHSLLSIEGT